jgi:periplasmic protein TonB
METVTRWFRPLAISMIVHGAVLGSGAVLLGTHGIEPETSSVFPVSLVFDSSVPGPPGTYEPAGPIGVPAPASSRAMTERPVSPPAPVPEPEAAPTPESALGASESTGAGSGGDGSGVGGGGAGGAGGHDGVGGGGVSSNYEPPRLLAGALPLDPDAGVALSVPPEIPVRLRVGADGRVKDIVPEIEHLAPAVLDALHRSANAMRFAPARRGGEPVEGWFSMTFVYRH